MQRAIAVRLGLHEVFAGALPLPSLPIWLVAHADLRRSARVRAVWDGLAAGLAEFYAVASEAPPPDPA